MNHPDNYSESEFNNAWGDNETTRDKLDAEILYYTPKLERAVEDAFNAHPDDAQARWTYMRNNWLDEAIADFDKYADTRNGLAALFSANTIGCQEDVEGVLSDFLGDLRS